MAALREIYPSSAPCGPLQCLDYYLQFDLIRASHDLFPPLRRGLIICSAFSHRYKRLHRDRVLWKYGSHLLGQQEIRNTLYHLKVDDARWLPRLFNRTDVSEFRICLPSSTLRALLIPKSAQGPYRDQEACPRAPPIDGFRSAETTEFLICSILDQFPTITMSSGEQKDQTAKLDANEGILILVIATTRALFECRTTLPERSYQLVLEVGKRTIKRTQTYANTRSVMSNQICV